MSTDDLGKTLRRSRANLYDRRLGFENKKPLKVSLENLGVSGMINAGPVLDFTGVHLKFATPSVQKRVYYLYPLNGPEFPREVTGDDRPFKLRVKTWLRKRISWAKTRPSNSPTF